MGIMVFALSRNICMFKLIEMPNIFESHCIGYIGDFFYDEKKRIHSKKIKQFMYITIMANTIFNTKQLIELSKEIDILEKLNIINKQDFDIIKNGVKIALEKNLYLKFEYD